MKKILLLCVLLTLAGCCLLPKDKPVPVEQIGDPEAKTSAAVWTVAVGDPASPIWSRSNCFPPVEHEQGCWLVRWLENGQTNEFHAWSVPVSFWRVYTK